MKKIVVTAYGSCVLQDVDALEWQVPNTSGTVSLKAGDVRTFYVTERAFDARIRGQLVTLSQKRVRVTDSLTPVQRSQPLITYTVDDVPGQRPRLTQVNNASLSVGAPAAIVLSGVNLIPGTYASAVIGSGTGMLTYTAVRKGAGGNKVKVQVNPGSTSTGVVVTISDEGDVLVQVTPTVASQANLIAAQIAANALASIFVGAVAGGTGAVRPQITQLEGGDDSGIALRIFPSVLSTSWLQLVANKPGNDGNFIALKLLTPTVGGSVVVTGNVIAVEPVIGAIGVADIAAQIVAEPTAAALVTATAVGTSNMYPSVFGPMYLYMGAGEGAVATVGGAAAAITAHSDTAMTLTVTAPDLLAAGVLASEQAVINIMTGYNRLQAQLPTVA